MTDNINPHNLEAEKQVLGSIILDNKAIKRLDITTDDFYAQKHKDIYKAMLALDADGLPIEMISLKEKGIEDIGYIYQIANEIVTTANIYYHADLIRESSIKRKIRLMCLKALSSLNTESVDDILSQLRANSMQLVKGRGPKIVSTRDIAVELNKFIERRSQNRNELSGITSGFLELDKLTDGFQPGEQIVIAARPGMGKSALAMAIAENCKVPVGFISIEMGPHQLGIRSLSTLSGVELWRLRKGILADFHWPYITEGLSELSQLPIYFSFSSRTTTEIERTITQMIESFDCRMIVVDYLQLTKGTDSKKRELEIAEVSRTLKLAAMSNNIPVIALSQLNREVEKRENKKPMLSDLRESGAIEQDADLVIFLSRVKDDEFKLDEESNAYVLELDIAKGRNCGLGSLKLKFNGDVMKFEPYKETLLHVEKK